MKTESTPRFILRLALTLLVITGIMAALLAAVNGVTGPIIAARNEKRMQEAITAVLPGGGEKIEDFTDETGLVTAVYASDLGYAVEVKPNGFDGPVTMMVGIGKDGAVLAVRVVSQTETAGLGAVSAAKTNAGERFRAQFAGANGDVFVSKDGGTVEAITGATVTSRAVCAGVSAALACVAALD